MQKMYLYDDCFSSGVEKSGDMCLQCEGTGFIDGSTIESHNQEVAGFLEQTPKLEKIIEYIKAEINKGKVKYDLTDEEFNLGMNIPYTLANEIEEVFGLRHSHVSEIAFAYLENPPK